MVTISFKPKAVVELFGKLFSAVQQVLQLPSRDGNGSPL